jgi:hypothetical protein
LFESLRECLATKTDSCTKTRRSKADLKAFIPFFFSPK